jgi:5'-nucleotidase
MKTNATPGLDSASRRRFIKQVGAAGLGLGLMSLNPLATYGRSMNSGDKRITIMHTNDTHARIEPFPDGSGRYANMGGAARRAALIKKIRQENPHNLLLDAGDVFQGTPYFNNYDGALDFELMSMMGYDASTIGNHEFDNKVEGFVEVAPKANFPFVNSNYDFSGAQEMGNFVQPHLIKQVDGVRVGIFGLGIAFESLVLPDLHKGVRYTDAVASASETAYWLRKNARCDMVICLSHLGYRYEDPYRVSDQLIANDIRGIDLIIGGHTHTLLDEPEIVERRGDEPTIISQVGHGGVVLGRLTFEFTRSNRIRRVYVANQSIDEATDKLV